MNKCCWRWRFGAYSVNREGSASSKYETEDVRFCPQCGRMLEKSREDVVHEKIVEHKQAIEKLEAEQNQAKKDGPPDHFESPEYCNECLCWTERPEGDHRPGEYKCNVYDTGLERDTRGRVIRPQQCIKECERRDQDDSREV